MERDGVGKTHRHTHTCWHTPASLAGTGQHTVLPVSCQQPTVACRAYTPTRIPPAARQLSGKQPPTFRKQQPTAGPSSLSWQKEGGVMVLQGGQGAVAVG